MSDEYVKVFVSVPMRSMTRAVDGKVFENPPQILRDAIGSLAAQGVAKVGNYDNVFFSVIGKSFYRAIPGSAANPTAGKPGEIHSEEEEMLSFVAPKETLEEIVKVLKENHPYEVPAIDAHVLVRHEFDDLG
jgi:hypothetical protein